MENGFSDVVAAPGFAERTASDGAARTDRRGAWRRWPVLAVAAGALVAGAAPAAAAPATAAGDRVVDCHVWAPYPNLLVSSARNMRCRAAARDIRGHQGPIKRRFTTPGGFRCVRMTGIPVSGQWRCVNDRRAYRFEFGD